MRKSGLDRPQSRSLRIKIKILASEFDLDIRLGSTQV